MKAYVFSIGEKTTDLCVELLKSYGFEVILYQDSTTLWEKLKRFYTEVVESGDEWAMRIDADIIPNKNVIKLSELRDLSWSCASGYDWYSQDRKAISVHVMNSWVVKQCLENIYEARDKTRPETYLWRVDDINPHTEVVEEFSCGLHGYAQQDHRDRIKNLKYLRNQPYDWELLDKIEALK